MGVTFNFYDVPNKYENEFNTLIHGNCEDYDLSEWLENHTINKDISFTISASNTSEIIAWCNQYEEITYSPEYIQYWKIKKSTDATLAFVNLYYIKEGFLNPLNPNMLFKDDVFLIVSIQR